MKENRILLIVSFLYLVISIWFISHEVARLLQDYCKDYWQFCYRHKDISSTIEKLKGTQKYKIYQKNLSDMSIGPIYSTIPTLCISNSVYE